MAAKPKINFKLKFNWGYLIGSSWNNIRSWLNCFLYLMNQITISLGWIRLTFEVRTFLRFILFLKNTYSSFVVISFVQIYRHFIWVLGQSHNMNHVPKWRVNQFLYQFLYDFTSFLVSFWILWMNRVRQNDGRCKSDFLWEGPVRSKSRINRK